MILTNEFILKWLQLQYPNLLVSGYNLNIIENAIQINLFNKINKFYFKLNNSYIFKVSQMKKKYELVNFIRELSVSKDYYSQKGKKTIIIYDFDKLNRLYQNSIKVIINQSYLSCVFIIHTCNFHSTIKPLRDILIHFSLPNIKTVDESIIITYNRIIKLLKKPLTKDVIDKIKEISYYYYMSHTDSLKLQQYIIYNLGKKILIPNTIKYTIVNEYSNLNHMYQYSYRKPIFLETMILCLFKHLENYSYNL